MLARYANLPFYGNMLAASGYRRRGRRRGARRGRRATSPRPSAR
jgi:hypothetical protein